MCIRDRLLSAEVIFSDPLCLSEFVLAGLFQKITKERVHAISAFAVFSSFVRNSGEEPVSHTHLDVYKRQGEASVGLRSDIDALPLKELSDHDHVSQVEGAMHACGHDGHAAVLSFCITAVGA